MKTQKVVLTEQESDELLHNFLIKSYIANGTIKVTPSEVRKNLKIEITKDELARDVEMVQREQIDYVIGYQIDSPTAEDMPTYYKIVSHVITSFNFSKYENMTIDELRSHLRVYDERTNKAIRGENLIEFEIDRACVGIYSQLKGGIYIEEDMSINVIEKIEELKSHGFLNEEQKRNIIKSLM
ncbi:hypothetical protein SAMN03097699_0590 [Flavobacteriaceae bacterium MAR_2010_188]|nr:hypothetical protein SAMN03097699_0590 [Flavobacteriaceae bacterium MAR_2010_188]